VKHKKFVSGALAARLKHCGITHFHAKKLEELAASEMVWYCFYPDDLTPAKIDQVLTSAGFKFNVPREPDPTPTDGRPASVPAALWASLSPSEKLARYRAAESGGDATDPQAEARASRVEAGVASTADRLSHARATGKAAQQEHTATEEETAALARAKSIQDPARRLTAVREARALGRARRELEAHEKALEAGGESGRMVVARQEQIIKLKERIEKLNNQ